MTSIDNDRRLHHVGFVVADASATAPRFAESLGLHWSGRVFEDPLQRVKVTFLSAAHADEAQIELVEPVGDNSPVRKFLELNKGGLHHLCYEVRDIEHELHRVRAAGGRLVSRPKPAIAFGGRRIAWVLSREALLVEFLETDKVATDV